MAYKLNKTIIVPFSHLSWHR